MPVYEYECSACGGRFEAIQKFSDAPLSQCRLCNAASVRKVLSTPAFVLKGSGWYVTDYPSEDRKKANTQESSDKPKTETNAAPSCTGGCCAGSCAPKG